MPVTKYYMTIEFDVAWSVRRNMLDEDMPAIKHSDFPSDSNEACLSCRDGNPDESLSWDPQPT